MALSPPPPSLASSSVVPNEDTHIELEQEGLRKLSPAELSQLVSTIGGDGSGWTRSGIKDHADRN